MITWADRLKDLYDKKLINKNRLNSAAEKGLITEEEKQSIVR